MKQPLLPGLALLLQLAAACGSVDAGAGAGEGGLDGGPGNHTDDTDSAPADQESLFPFTTAIGAALRSL